MGASCLPVAPVVPVLCGLVDGVSLLMVALGAGVGGSKGAPLARFQGDLRESKVVLGEASFPKTASLDSVSGANLENKDLREAKLPLLGKLSLPGSP